MTDKLTDWIGRSETLRDYLKASVRTMQLDPSVAIDPEAALGYRVAPEGLQLVRASSTNVAYSSDGEPPPGVGAPMMMLMPLPIQVPEAQRTELCPQILAQMVQLEGENTKLRKLVAYPSLDREMLQNVIRREV